jgi:hypothetical protein
MLITGEGCSEEADMVESRPISSLGMPQPFNSRKRRDLHQGPSEAVPSAPPSQVPTDNDLAAKPQGQEAPLGQPATAVEAKVRDHLSHRAGAESAPVHYRSNLLAP